jgi:YesN/AraC family two-component response regulator
VSGFACKNSNEYIKAISLKYDLSYDALHETYQSLKPEMPPKPYVDTLINPLCYMLELAHIKSSKNIRSEQSLIERITQYIRTNYTQDITSQTLCHKFNCSRSHLSRIFNEEMKTSIREHITSLRIESAKTLLRDTRLEIAEIAMAIGFSEPNYFTTIFKKHTNLTPSAYRKSYS